MGGVSEETEVTAEVKAVTELLERLAEDLAGREIADGIRLSAALLRHRFADAGDGALRVQP